MAQFQIGPLGKESLVRVGMNPHPYTPTDSLYADSLYAALGRDDLAGIIRLQRYYSWMMSSDSLKEKSYGAIAYLLGRWTRERLGYTVDRGDILTDDMYRYFMSDSCNRLKDYLRLKYRLDRYKPSSVKQYIDQRTFYDDLLMFNDPGRSRWDCTEQVVKLIPLRSGDRVVDVGCGFGYNTLRLARIVGGKGIVYGTDTEEKYIEHFDRVLRSNNVSNVKAVHVKSDGLGVDDTVDLIFMSSLYHIIYTWSREDERKPLMHSIQKQLRRGGHLVIVDNNNLHGAELNNCHVDPRLVEAQLYYYGFEKESLHILSPQRYLLVMKYVGEHNGEQRQPCGGGDCLEVSSAQSVVHIGSLDSYDITELGVDAARYVYDYASSANKRVASIAINKYKSLIPSENFGGEYSALQWLCEVWTADKDGRRQMLSDPLDASFYHFLTDDSCAVLKYYLLHKYKLGSERERMLSDSLLEMSGEVGRTHRSFLEDYILALNPKRPQWERTDDIMLHLGLRPGDTVADIGCGSGFFSYRFAKAVGERGHVYAIELKGEHIDRLNAFVKSAGIENIEVIEGKEDVFELPAQVGCMFMCSLYHIYYGVISDKERDSYLRSMVNHLRDGGRLVVVDNGPVSEEKLPYHGPYISKELIIKQLSNYGLEIEESHQIIPQRYMLIFKKK